VTFHASTWRACTHSNEPRLGASVRQARAAVRIYIWVETEVITMTLRQWAASPGSR